MQSKYSDPDRVREAVDAGHHREFVGGAWDEIGILQFEFLKSHGLWPSHTLLDVGCGSLRGGIHFVRYLDPGKYFGVDVNEPLLTAGYETELGQAGLQDRLPRQNLHCTGDFDLSIFGIRFDFALAQSLFTHLTFNQIRQCLERLAGHMTLGGTFFATFFEAPEATPAYLPARHSPGNIVTRGADNPYHYRFEDLKYAAAGLPWEVRYIGDWQHPRGQRMAAFVRQPLEAARDCVVEHVARPGFAAPITGDRPANPSGKEGEQMSVTRARQPGIIVLGMHRSGTSLVAEMIERWGAYGRDEGLLPADAWNERGYWEYGPLVDVNRDLLRAVNSSWDVPPGDHDRAALAGLAQDAALRSRALRLLEDMQAGERAWFWKDPRLPVLLPFWKQLWGDVVYIVPVRDPVDTALSLQRRDGFSMSRSLIVWQRYMSEILLDSDVRSAALFLPYEKLLTDGVAECTRLCAFLEERLAIQSPNRAERASVMAGAIVPRPTKGRTAVGFGQTAIATPAQKALYGMLERLATGSPEELPTPGDLEPHWREYLAGENAGTATPAPKDVCEVFWRGSTSEYRHWRRRSVPVQEQRGPQSLRVALPATQDGVAAFQIELSQRAGFAKVDAIALYGASGDIVWAWDGRPESLRGLLLSQVGFCARQPSGRGCMLQVDGDDSRIEVVLDAAQSASLGIEATVAIECEYIPSLEYLLQENAHIAAELRESNSRLKDLMSQLEERVATAERAEQAILQSRIWRVLKGAGGLLLRATGPRARKNDGH